MRQGLLELQDFIAARGRIAGRLHPTPLVRSRQLAERFGVALWFKAESFQKTGSFKVRGVLNRLASVTPEERERGFVSMSAGNHAAALSWGASSIGARATIVMPERALPSKIAATRGYGGEVVLTSGPLMDEVGRLERERGLVLVHPFDDPGMMAGHGTAGLEILEGVPDVEALLVPIGGGGLIGGVAAAVKSVNPRVRVVGVEPEVADAMCQALAAGRPVPIGHPVTVADGLAAPFAGEHTLRHVQRFVDEVVRVSEAEIVESLKLVMTRAKLVVEPAAAAALAPLLGGTACLRGARRVVAVLSGGNVDPGKLREVL